MRAHCVQPQDAQSRCLIEYPNELMDSVANRVIRVILVAVLGVGTSGPSWYNLFLFDRPPFSVGPCLGHQSEW